MLLPRMGRFRSARHTALRKSVIAASAAILLFGPTAAVANAEPSDSAETSVDLPAQLVEALSRDLKISPEDYLHRADLAQQVAAFAVSAQRQYPQVFAGSWLDNAGKAVVALAQGPGAEEARAAAESAGFEVRNVAKSEATLRGEKSAFERWLETQPEAVSALIRGVVIDTVNNSIAVRVDQAGVPMPSFVDPSRVIVMAPPVAAEPLPEATPIASELNRGSVTGGDGFTSAGSQSSLRCSFGFNATDASGATVNISAGHCDPEYGTANAAVVHELLPNERLGARLGSFQKSVLGSQDYSIIRIDDAVAGRFANNGIRVPGAAPVRIEGVAVPVVGAPVCKAGSRTGFSCGIVNAVDQSVQVGDRLLTQSFSANICALPGDSGGPIVTGRLALGISSASSVADYPICAIPDLIGALTGNAPQLFAQPISVVLSDNPGLRIRTE